MGFFVFFPVLSPDPCDLFIFVLPSRLLRSRASKVIHILDQLWIWPQIKYIFNELNIIFSRTRITIAASRNAAVTSSAVDFDVISITWTEQVRHRIYAWWLAFSSPYIDSLCSVRNQMMYELSWRTVICSFECYFGASYFRCLQREINTKITPSWVPKQFFTRVHASFYISWWIWVTWTDVKTQQQITMHKPCP